MSCKCGNPQEGFECVCKWIKKHRGNVVYSCDVCGIYVASDPKCEQCEIDQIIERHNKKTIT